jgi:hypothetical protein
VVSWWWYVHHPPRRLDRIPLPRYHEPVKPPSIQSQVHHPPRRLDRIPLPRYHEPVKPPSTQSQVHHPPRRLDRIPLPRYHEPVKPPSTQSQSLFPNYLGTGDLITSSEAKGGDQGAEADARGFDELVVSWWWYVHSRSRTHPQTPDPRRDVEIGLRAFGESLRFEVRDAWKAHPCFRQHRLT